MRNLETCTTLFSAIALFTLGALTPAWADYQVSGKVKRLERLLGGGPPRVVVELELALVRLSDNALLLVDNFGDEEPEDGSDVGSAVVALNKATRRVFDRFLDRALTAVSPMAGDLTKPGATSPTSASAP